MNESTRIRQAVKAALAVGAAASLGGMGTALAQSAAPAPGTASSTNLSRIQVTGSHIPRTSIAQAQPVVTINRQDIENTGFTTVGQLLQNMSSAGAALNVQVNNGGNGMQLVNLHDLGSKRVLVLVNGQRWLPTLGGSVDLSTIPISVIQRVEVLMDGASAVYGSEAIAGVINIITVKNYSGAEAHAYYGAYDAHGDGGGWDGKTQRYSFTVGQSGDRSSVLLSAGYYEQKPVWAGQRNISKEPIVGFGNITGSSGTPGGRFELSGQGTPPGYSGCAPTSTSSWYCDLAGPINGPNANPHAFTNADRYNYAPPNYLRTPQERWYVYSQGHYDLTNNVSFHFLTSYNRRNSRQLLAPNPFFIGLYGYTAGGLKMGISGTNPYNPFGVDLVPYQPTSSSGFNAWCSKYGTNQSGTGCTSNYDTLLLEGRRDVEGGHRIYSQNNQTFYFTGGFSGFFTLAGNQWNWETNYIYGQTLRTDITTGLQNTLRMQKALGPVSACNASPGCVPLDLFGGYANGQGTITPAMTNYINFTAHNVYKEVMRDYNGNLAGNFYNGWYAGPWGVAVGYEYEEYSGRFSPDPILVNGNIEGVPQKPTQGRQNTNAEYAEITIPFAHDAPFAKSLSVDLANRWSQFRWDGTGNVINENTAPPSISTGQATGRAHASTARATIKWQPIQQVLVRGTWSQGFRTPSISELFSGSATGFPTVNDPCVNPVAPIASLPSQYACPSNATQPNAQIGTTSGGNAKLSPERALTRSAGVVYSPRWAPGLDVSADYYKIEVDDIIGSLGPQYYLNACYYGGDTNACGHIVRPGAAINKIFALTTNSGSFKTNGWDVNLRYQFPTTPVGDFTFRMQATFVKEAVSCSAATKVSSSGTFLPNCVDAAGSIDSPNRVPKHRYNISLNWSRGPWSAFWKMDVIGPMYETCSNSSLHSLYGVSYTNSSNWCSEPNKVSAAYYGKSVGLHRLGTTIYHDIQGSYTVNAWNTTFSVGINNVFNKLPPVSYTAFANSYSPYFYRTPGRFVYGRISVRF